MVYHWRAMETGGATIRVQANYRENGPNIGLAMSEKSSTPERKSHFQVGRRLSWRRFWQADAAIPDLHTAWE